MHPMARHIVAFVCALTCLVLVPAYAQSNEKTSGDATPADETVSKKTSSVAARVLEFIESNPPASLTVIPESERTTPSIELIKKVSAAVMSSDHDTLSDLQPDPNYDVFPDSNTDYAKAWRFTQSIQRLAPKKIHGDDNAELLEFLTTVPAEDGWYLQSTGLLLATHLHISKYEFLNAGRYVDEANRIIPNELSPEVTDTQLRAAAMMTIMHGIQGNVDFMLETAEMERTARARLGETIDKRELISNFIFALNRVRDFEGAHEVGKLLDNYNQSETSIAGLGETYLADTDLELGHYAEAERLALKALSVSDHPVVQSRGRSALMIAVAGLGREAQSRAIQTDMGWTYPANPSEGASGQRLSVGQMKALHADALNAMNRGDSEQAVALMTRRMNALVTQVQGTNSADMSALMANLENTRERQLERENALKREAELKAVQLDQQKRLNIMLTMMLCLLAVALLSAIIFLRYRERVNRKLHRLSEEALSAERMKIEFLGVVNHELRTPLNGIIGISDALIHHAKDPVVRGQAQTIQDSGQVLFEMIRSLIDMSTLDNGKMTLDTDDTNLATLIENEACEWISIAEDKGLTYTHFVDPNLDHLVQGDDDRITQCVQVLLSNATRFTQSGRVHLHATAERSGAETVMTIIVADTGQGMSPEVQSRLFTPFLQADLTMTRKYGGVGLNLAIIRQLAHLMNGDVTVTSNEGRGSEFVFTARFPVAVETIAEPMRAEPTKAKSYTQASIRPSTAAMTSEATPALIENREGQATRIPMPPLLVNGTKDSAAASANPDKRSATDRTETAAVVEKTPPLKEAEAALLQPSTSKDDNHTGPELDADLFDVVDLMMADTLFPASAQPQGAERSVTVTGSTHSNATSAQTILIVEDEASNRDVLRALLEPEGYSCLPAASAQEGLALLRQRAVDLVIMDIRMPEMDGIEAIQTIRLRGDAMSAVPIIALTADPKAETRTRALLAGADLFLTKPIDRRTLLRGLENCLGETSTARQGAA